MATETRPRFITHSSGVNVPLMFDLDKLDIVLNYKPDEGDIIIMTYPKCGTTWTQYIVYLLMNNGDPLPKNKTLKDYVPFLEFYGCNPLEDLPRPRAMKVHLSFEHFKYNEKAKYICVVRNPKDCCVSLYHHGKAFIESLSCEGRSFHDSFEAFIKGQVIFNDYFDHLLSLYNYRDKPNVLFLLYEDMKADPMAAVKKIANFISDILPGCDFNNDFIAKVAEASDINSMKKLDPSKFSPPRNESAEPYIRKGLVGDWVNYFTEEQNLRLEKTFFERLNGTGAEHLWKNHGIFS